MQGLEYLEYRPTITDTSSLSVSPTPSVSPITHSIQNVTELLISPLMSPLKHKIDGSVSQAKVLEHFASSVVIITAHHQNIPIGFTVNTFSVISQQPSIVSFCADYKDAHWPLIELKGLFCANILSEKQKDLSITFARKGGTRFRTTDNQVTHSGIPTLANALAHIECEVMATIPAGEHMIVLAQVNYLQEISRGKPLVSYKDKLGTFKPIRDVTLSVNGHE